MPHLPPGDDEIEHASGLPRETWNPDATRPSITLAEEQAQKRTPAPLSTPHDTALADLHGYNRSASQNNATNTASNIAALDSVTPQPNSPYSNAFFSNLSPTSEPLFDPFTGAHIGDQLPDQIEDESKMEEELWTHLSKILKLQSVIAEKHVKMEGIGLKKPGAARGKSKGVPRRSSTNIGKRWLQGADEGVDEEADEEALRKRELEEDFAGLGDKFAGRKDAIDGIMKNLEELSGAVTNFHALRTPTIKFPSASGSESRQGSQLSPPLSQQGASPPGPPNTSLSAPAALSPPKAKPSRLLPAHDEHPPTVFDSPLHMHESLPVETEGGSAH